MQMLTRRIVRDYGEFYLPSENMLDAAASKEILNGEAYPRIATTAKVIWDVGANIGAAAMYFARAYPHAEIHCFEPSRDMVWECLQENTNRMRSRCRIYQWGLAGEDCEREMSEWHQSTVTRSCKVQTHEVPVALPDLFEFRKPPSPEKVTIIKINTEGCEVEILEALGDERHEVPLYYLEYHSDRDRRKLDELLPDHHLVRASVQRKHRGNLTYLHGNIQTSEDSYEIT